MDEKEIKIEQNEKVEKLDISDLDQYSGGGIGNAKKEKRKDLDDDVTGRA